MSNPNFLFQSKYRSFFLEKVFWFILPYLFQANKKIFNFFSTFVLINASLFSVISAKADCWSSWSYWEFWAYREIWTEVILAFVKNIFTGGVTEAAWHRSKGGFINSLIIMMALYNSRALQNITDDNPLCQNDDECHHQIAILVKSG